jgi:hypothetical protein
MKVNDTNESIYEEYFDIVLGDTGTCSGPASITFDMYFETDIAVPNTPG